MPKIITQHRRGTTEEWLASDVKPKAGELFIEETDQCISRTIIDTETSAETTVDT